MSTSKKSAASRAKEFDLAILRIQHGRAHTGATFVSFSSVAREVGVTPALIHNHYPDVAMQIRKLQGREDRSERDTARLALRTERENSRKLRAEVKELEQRIRMLTSINERLLAELHTLRQQTNVRQLQAPASVHKSQELKALPR